MKTQVAVIRCEDYDESRVHEALQRGIALLGGPGRFARPQETLLLKPNLLAGAAPQRAVTTHPAVFKSLGQIFQKQGSRLTWGDSAVFGSLKPVSEKAGLWQEAQRLGLETADFETAVKVSFPQARLARQLELARGALQADGLISVGKMKTHGFMRITGAVKNQFGLVPGLRKSEFHVKMQAADHFATMLVDITRFLRPRLFVLDGILAMEGNGPQGGDPRRLQTLLLGSDPVAVDAVFCRLINLDSDLVATCRAGRECGLGTFRSEEIELLGDPLDSLIARDFQVERKPDLSTRLPIPVFFKNRITRRPLIDYSLCNRCGSCVEVCPVVPKAVDWKWGKNEKPGFNYASCIRCYCCQEVCPEKAIRLNTPLLSRVFRRM